MTGEAGSATRPCIIDPHFPEHCSRDNQEAVIRTGVNVHRRNRVADIDAYNYRHFEDFRVMGDYWDIERILYEDHPITSRFPNGAPSIGWLDPYTRHRGLSDVSSQVINISFA